MNKEKFSKNVNSLRLAPEIDNPSFENKIARPPLIFDKKVVKEATHNVRIYHVYAPGAGTGLPTKGKTSDNGKCHAHPYDEFSLFLGTDPLNPTELGGELEFWIGEGDEAQRFIINKSSAEWIPAGVLHDPHYYRKVNNPDKPIVQLVIGTEPEYAISRTANLPAGFTTGEIKQKETGKGKYTKYVNPLRVATEIYDPVLVGKAAHPPIRFDWKVFPEATRLVEIFHLYAAGTGFGLPTKGHGTMAGEPIPNVGGGHTHPFDETFLFIGTNPHDPTDLGGDLEFWQGEDDEAQIFKVNKATAELVLEGTVHNPHLYTKVNRMIFQIVLATTKNFSMKRVTSLPPGFKHYGLLDI